MPLLLPCESSSGFASGVLTLDGSVCDFVSHCRRELAGEEIRRCVAIVMKVVKVESDLFVWERNCVFVTESFGASRQANPEQNVHAARLKISTAEGGSTSRALVVSSIQERLAPGIDH
jgi:hypothetical protein